MRTRILKVARGGVSIAFVAGGLGVVGALGAGLATSGVASAAPGPIVVAAYNCPTPGPTLTLTFPYHVTTVPATVQATSHHSVTTEITFFVSPTLVGLAAAATEWTLSITSATIRLKPVGLTTGTKQTLTTAHAQVITIAHHTIQFTTTTVLVTKTVPNPTTTTSGNTGHPVVTTGLTLTFSFTHTFHVTGLAGTTATFKPTGKITVKVLTAITITCSAKHQATITNIFTSPIVAFVAPPVTLTPASGALPAGQGSVAYAPVTLTAAGGAGGFTWSTPGTLDGLVFHPTGAHATISGTPHTNTTAVTLAFTVTATTTPTATKHATNHYTIHIAASPLTTPAFSLLQPFRLTVTPGTITMTCTSTVAHTAKPTVGHDVTVNPGATCALVHLGTFKLNEQRHLIGGWGHSLIISTARGASTDDWSLSAIMVPTSHTLTGNTNCNIVPGFCNKTTTTAGNNLPTLPHYRNTTITPNYLYLTKSTCRPNNTNPATPYFNTNTPPTNKAGQNPATVTTHGLAVSHEICTAATGSSGGQFFVTTLGYTLIAPGDIYAGVYYGTVQYTLTPSGIKPVVTVTPLTNFVPLAPIL